MGLIVRRICFVIGSPVILIALLFAAIRKFGLWFIKDVCSDKYRYITGHSSPNGTNYINWGGSKFSPYIVIIENKTDDLKRAILFGCNEFLMVTNHGSDEGIVVKMAYSNVSYLQLLQQPTQRPFILGGMVLYSDNHKQVKTEITYQCRDANGQRLEDTFSIPVPDDQPQQGIADTSVILQLKKVKWWMSNKKREKIMQTTIYDAAIKYPIDGNSQLSLMIEPRTKLEIVMYPALRELQPSKLKQWFVWLMK